MIDYKNIKIDFRFSPTICTQDPSLNDFVISVIGMVRAWNTEKKEYKKIGLVHALILKSQAAIANNLHPIDVAHKTSAALTSLYNEFFVDGETHPDVLREMPSANYDDNMLYIKQLDILEVHRGHGAGLIAMYAMISHFKQDIVSLKAFPMQYAGQNIYEDEIDDEWHIPFGKAVKYDNSDFNKHQQKLFKYYARLGFRRIRKSEYMILDTKGKMPTPPTIDNFIINR